MSCRLRPFANWILPVQPGYGSWYLLALQLSCLHLFCRFVVQARTFFRLDPARSARVWELLCSAGWLRGNNPEEAEDKRRWARTGGAKRPEAVTTAVNTAASEETGYEAGAVAGADVAPSGVTTEGPDATAAVGLGEEVDGDEGVDVGVEQEAADAAVEGAG